MENLKNRNEVSTNRQNNQTKILTISPFKTTKVLEHRIKAVEEINQNKRIFYEDLNFIITKNHDSTPLKEVSKQT